MLRLFLLLLLTLFSYNVSSVEKWSRFRGEGGQGKATSKLPLKLTKSNLKWSFDLKGGGTCSPVIWDSKLFITAANGGKLTLFCINAIDGKKVWSKDLTTGEYHVHRFNNQAASTPCLTENEILLTWFDGSKNKAFIGSFSHAGDQLWVKEIGEFKGRHGFTMNLATLQGKVIVTHLHQGESYVAALNNKDGSELWKVKCPPEDASYSTPLIRKNGSAYEAIVTGPSIGMMSFDLNSGKVNWSLKKAHDKRTVVSPVEVVIDGESYLTSSEKTYGYSAVKISGKPEVMWRAKKMGSYVPTHLARKSSVYVLKDSGTLTEYNVKEQKKIAGVDLKGNFYASPLLINDHIYCMTRDGKLVIIKPEGLQTVHKLDLNMPEDADFTDATPAAANDSLYIRLGNRLDCYK